AMTNPATRMVPTPAIQIFFMKQPPRTDLKGDPIIKDSGDLPSQIHRDLREWGKSGISRAVQKLEGFLGIGRGKLALVVPADINGRPAALAGTPRDPGNKLRPAFHPGVLAGHQHLVRQEVLP